ncbi:hypothetical protein [Mycobacterium servetii]|uniref:ESX-1 secretion-associated protein EspJ n=1 Tax=Mycobacterium servetii TaxID=3237418 RepID=A0ABV4BTL5_9MYCO
MIVDPARLETAGSALQALVFPVAPPRLVVGGRDALSAAIDETLPVVEAPVVDGLPAVKAALTRTGSSITAAAGIYAETDQRLSDHVSRVDFGATGQSRSTSARRSAGAAAEHPDDGETPGAPEAPALQGLSLPSMPQLGPLTQHGQSVGMAGYTAQSVLQSTQGAVSSMPGGSATPAQLSGSTTPEPPADDDEAHADGAGPGARASETVPDQPAGQPITAPSQLEV